MKQTDEILALVLSTDRQTGVQLHVRLKKTKSMVRVVMDIELNVKGVSPTNLLASHAIRLHAKRLVNFRDQVHQSSQST